MFRRAVASVLARRFSPRATPRTAPARSLHSSLSDFPIGDGLLCAYTFAAAVSAGGCGGLAVLHFMKDPSVDESAAGKVTGARKELTDNKVKFKKLDMNSRFERWIVKNNKTYRDEEEKAMRFQLFKATVEWIESQPLSVQKRCFEEINGFADYTEQEKRCLLAYPDGIYTPEYYEMVKSALAKQEKEEPVIRRPDVKQGYMRATQVSTT